VAKERPATVLVAEDDDQLRETLKEIMSLSGYRVLEAADGERALEQLSTEHVEVLILDLDMPKVDGLGVLERIDGPRPAVILHSAFEYYSPELLRQLGMDGKVFRSLRKPVPPPVLISSVEEAVEQLDG
jgi:two-component system OmpR family response regulator